MDEKTKFRKWAILIFAAILLIWALFNTAAVQNVIDFIFLLLTPFIIGIFVALLLNIPMKFFQKKFTKKNKKGEIKTRKGLALALSVICVIAVILIVILLIIPQLVNVVVIFVDNIPYYQEQLLAFVSDLQTRFPDLDFGDIKEGIVNSLADIGKQVAEQAPTIITSSFQFITGAFMAIVNFFIGIGFAFLLLIEKEPLKAQLKKMMYVYLKEDKTNKILKWGRLFVNAFNKTIVSQCVIAVLLGGVTMLGAVIMQIPYAVQVGVLIGFTALIPVIGPVIGIIIGAIIIVTAEPIKALIFIIFVVVIWQIEENFIRPLIVGKRVGLPGIWLFVATIIGITALGITGIFISIPIVTVIYVCIKEKIENTKIPENIKE